MEKSPLNENQARHLRIYLSRLRVETDELLEWLTRLPPPEPAWLPAVRGELEQLRRAIRGTAVTFGIELTAHPIDLRRRVGAWAGMWWASILDCRPAALRGYGAVHPELERTLAPAVDEMAALLLRIGSLVESGRPRRGS